VSKSALKFIDGYYIRYREMIEDEPLKDYKILTKVAHKDDFGVYSHVVPNLDKFTQYHVFVSPFFRSVEGQPSNSMLVFTDQDSECNYIRFYFYLLFFFACMAYLFQLIC